MSRTALALAAGVAALFSVSAMAAAPKLQMGIPVAPNGGNASIDQWGGIDDAFAVDPDGGAKAAPSAHNHAPMAHNQGDENSDGDDDGPDTDHSDEVLRI